MKINSPNRCCNIERHQVERTTYHGHPIQDNLPVHYRVFNPKWHTKMKEIVAYQQSRWKHVKPTTIKMRYHCLKLQLAVT